MVLGRVVQLLAWLLNLLFLEAEVAGQALVIKLQLVASQACLKIKLDHLLWVPLWLSPDLACQHSIVVKFHFLVSLRHHQR